jgi:hypothetical protein
LPELSARILQVAPGPAIRLTLPDPAPMDVTVGEVRGFMMKEDARYPSEESSGGMPSGDWFGGLLIIGKFLADPIGTFGSAVAGRKP